MQHYWGLRISHVYSHSPQTQLPDQQEHCCDVEPLCKAEQEEDRYEEALPEDGYDSEVLELHPSSSSSSGKDDGNGWDSEDSDTFLAREEMYN